MTEEEAKRVYRLGVAYYHARKPGYPEAAKNLKGHLYQQFVDGYQDTAKKAALKRLITGQNHERK